MFKDIKFQVIPEEEYPQIIKDQVIREYRALERSLAFILDDKIYVMVTRGAKEGSGYSLTVDRIEVDDTKKETFTNVYATFKDPVTNQPVQGLLTYPVQIVETDLAFLSDVINLVVKYDD